MEPRDRSSAVPPLEVIQITLLLVFALTMPPPATAHEGPPFPLILDHALPNCQMSIWADPDIGEARFFIVLEEPGGGGAPGFQPQVSLWVEPVNGRLELVTYSAAEQSQRNRLQFLATPHFDQRDQWTVGVEMAVPGQPPAEVVAQVESTPPGLGPWDLAIYALPFVMFGGLWVYAILRNRNRTTAGTPSRPGQTPYAEL